MGAATLTNSLATHVSESAPTTNYNGSWGLYLRTSTGADSIGYVYFSRPFPLGATILSAKLKIYNAYAFESATHTINLLRLGVAFSASKVTFNTRPTTFISGTKSLVKSGVVAIQTEWEFDIADWMQTIANGGPNYGIQIKNAETILRTFYSDIHPLSAFRPRLEVTWSDAPATPGDLAPSGGRKVGLSKPTLRATYLDVSGATALQAVQAQINSTDVWNAVAPGPAFDTGIVTTSVPEVDLTQSFARTVQFGTTNLSTNITGAAGNFETADIGQPIIGTNVPGGTTITAVAAGGGSATMSAAATGTGTTVGGTITRTYVGLTDGQIVFWRIRFQDAAGLWSSWSSSTTFQYDTKGVLTVTNPPSGTPKVEDTTPPISWTFSGETQAAYQIQIRHTETTGTVVIDWDSGKVTSTVTSVTVPAGKITEVGKTFTVTVRIWDNKQRETVPGNPAYVEVERSFTFTPGATTGTTGLVATAGDPRPTVTLTWSRTSAPDQFNILRNGKVIQGGIIPTEVFVSGTSYSWTDNSPSPARALVYSVQAVVNGVASTTNASATVTVHSLGIWLREPASGLELLILGKEDRAFTRNEQVGVLQSIADNSNPVMIHQALGGFQGKISGTLRNYASKTAQQWRDQFVQLQNLRVKLCWLTVGDYTFRVVVHDFSYAQRAVPKTGFDIGFQFYQQDSLNSIILGS